MTLRPPRTWLRVLAWAWALLALPVAAQAPASLEFPIKAAFLYKFGEFVELPSQVLGASTDPYSICIVGDAEFAALVANAVKNERVQGRPVIVRDLPLVGPSDMCHVAYLAGAPTQSVAQALVVLEHKPVLTVTDELRDRTAPGIVHFMIRNNRVRFAINEQTAAENGLRIASSLLNLAVNVRRRTTP